MVVQVRGAHPCYPDRPGDPDDVAEAGDENDDEGDDEDNADEKPQRGGGGAWRSFVRKQRSGDLRTVGQMYRALQAAGGPGLLQDCIREGEAATSRHKAGRGGNSFGPAASAIRRQVQSRELAVRAQRLQQDGGDAALDILLGDAAAHNYNLGETIAMAKKLHCKVNELVRNEEKAAADAVQQFAVEKTREYRNAIAQVMPSDSKSAAGSFIARPAGLAGAQVVESTSTWSADAAAKLASHCAALGRRSNVLTALDHEAAYLHSTKRNDAEDEKMVSSSDDEADKDTLCWLRGGCMHGEDGRKQWGIRNDILAAMKVACPIGSLERDALQDGRVFIRLMPSVLEPPSDCRLSLAELSELWGLDTCARFWHVSHMSFSPYHPMVQEMIVAIEREALTAAPGDGEIALKARVDTCAFHRVSPSHRRS